MASTSSRSAPWPRPIDTEVDNLYDLTDDEQPLSAISSIVSEEDSAIVVIPSPSAWPSVNKLQSHFSIDSSRPSTISAFVDSELKLELPKPSRLSERCSGIPTIRIDARSNTPSLDGSQASATPPATYCPPTPEFAPNSDSSPIRLRPDALQTLGFIHDDHSLEPTPTTLTPADEMLQVPGASNNNWRVSTSSSNYDDEERLSAVSVPSPIGFFHTEDPVAPTSPSQSVSSEEYYTSDKDKAPQEHPTLVEDESEWYDEQYNERLRDASRINLGLTSNWLAAQQLYERSDSSSDESDQTTKTPSSTRQLRKKSSMRRRHGSPRTSVPSKSVRFANVLARAAEAEKSNPSQPGRDDTLLRGFRHLHEQTREADVFVHRANRKEALALYRGNMTAAHCERVTGKYEPPSPDALIAPSRPISSITQQPQDDSGLRAAVASAQRERRALDKIKPASWALEAAKFLNGGSLMAAGPSAAVRAAGKRARVLDVGGNTTCDWAWQVALENPDAEVTTAYEASQADRSAGGDAKSWVVGPANHRRVAVHKLWNLPFPDESFDVVSVRSLHEVLRRVAPRLPNAGGNSFSGSSAQPLSALETCVAPASSTTINPMTTLEAALAARAAGDAAAMEALPQDEIDRCLEECLRVLRPGGYLDFAVVDADLIDPAPLGRAMAVEFAFNLRTRGYDPALTKSFLGRLRRVGFQHMRRAWVALPMGTPPTADSPVSPTSSSGSSGASAFTFPPAPASSYSSNGSATSGTSAVAPIAALVGSWAWERWMLKLSREMGRDEAETVRELAGVLAEGAREGGAWRWLSGWARKDL